MLRAASPAAFREFLEPQRPGRPLCSMGGTAHCGHGSRCVSAAVGGVSARGPLEHCQLCGHPISQTRGRPAPSRVELRPGSYHTCSAQPLGTRLLPGSFHPKPVASSGRRDDVIPLQGRWTTPWHWRGPGGIPRDPWWRPQVLPASRRAHHCPLPTPLLTTGGLQQQRAPRLGALSPRSGHPPPLPRGHAGASAPRTHFPESSWSSGPWPPCCSWLAGSAERRARFHVRQTQQRRAHPPGASGRNLGLLSHRKPQGCLGHSARGRADFSNGKSLL